MKIMNYTRREASWQPRLGSGPRDAVLGTILEQLCSNGFYTVNCELSHEGIMQALIAREAQRTTAMGEGIAFPHARLPQLKQALFAVATFEEPVMFEEFPVQIICLILVPTSDPSVSLKIMAQFSRLLMEQGVKEQVLNASDPAGLRNIFKAHNPRIDKPILARDIMRPPRFSVLDTDSVATCSHLMSVNNLQAVPVLNDRREVLGEITVERLFRYGLPEFFSNLKSVSFIAEFDPFEKYFDDESDIKAGDMMEPSARIVPMDYTIMEIVFDLAIQNYLKLYVTDQDGRWIGAIDKGLVLDNVINH
ncbi:PTS sugar transporter subunit IIA [Pontiella sulfatireligans]|uniref:PTS system 2-O-alpha-mannosyl-D-glycerate-specific EIIABC component n=1 Tax=Pontiella sulfatireligans TaxID=2750658 RepID=A0A6C2UKX2_9BACT|nr:PTS sugar transporter subunit IIA [Pontiella sulfatireligans]VGO20619.1 PTS system 2-O-alpha-mannosyl-D-glycerate-specific EIIABC component [Pontiella sulfatireligans]